MFCFSHHSTYNNIYFLIFICLFLILTDFVCFYILCVSSMIYIQIQGQRKMNALDYSNDQFKKTFYSLRSDLTDRVLDIEQKGDHAGTATIYKGWAGDNQQFAIKRVGATNTYTFQSKSGGFLTVSDNSDNAKITLSGLDNNKPKPNQLFKISKKSKDGHVIQTYCGKVLDVFQQKKDDGTPVGQYKYGGDKKKNQHWHFCDPKDITSSSSHND